MNNKQAKRLRRMARKATKGMKNTLYVRNPATAATELSPNCTRKYYKQLKKLFKAA